MKMNNLLQAIKTTNALTNREIAAVTRVIGINCRTQTKDRIREILKKVHVWDSAPNEFERIKYFDDNAEYNPIEQSSYKEEIKELRNILLDVK